MLQVYGGITLTQNEGTIVKNAVFNDHPEFFWTDSNCYSVGTKGLALVENKKEWSEALYKEGYEEVITQTKQLIRMAGISDEMSDYEKGYNIFFN